MSRSFDHVKPVFQSTTNRHLNRRLPCWPNHIRAKLLTAAKTTGMVRTAWEHFGHVSTLASKARSSSRSTKNVDGGRPRTVSEHPSHRVYFLQNTTNYCCRVDTPNCSFRYRRIRKYQANFLARKQAALARQEWGELKKIGVPSVCYFAIKLSTST